MATLTQLVRPVSAALAVGWMILIFTLSAQPDLPSVPWFPWFPHLDKVIHIAFYAILSALFRGSMALNQPNAIAIATGLTTAYGLTDEIHQSFVPGRVADVWDLGADALGGLIGAVCAQWMLRRFVRPAPATL